MYLVPCSQIVYPAAPRVPGCRSEVQCTLYLVHEQFPLLHLVFQAAGVQCSVPCTFFTNSFLCCISCSRLQEYSVVYLVPCSQTVSSAAFRVPGCRSEVQCTLYLVHKQFLLLHHVFKAAGVKCSVPCTLLTNNFLCCTLCSRLKD